MHILVTNDDGVHAAGLMALANALQSLGRVTILAPDRNWSASGHVKTLERPLRVRETRLTDGTPAFCTDGAPSDSVALALLGFVPEKVDLVVSGINPNANVGHDVTYSGTVTAAMEAAIAGINGIAVSVDRPEDYFGPIDYTAAAQAAVVVARKVMEQQLSPNIVMNVNVPYCAFEDFKGFQVTRMGLRIYRDALVSREDPRGRPYYWIGGETPIGKEEDGTDYGALKKGYVSITPIQLDLTAHQFIQPLQDWQWK